MFAGCGHGSGLLMRLILPLALMKSAGTVRLNWLDAGRANL